MSLLCDTIDLNHEIETTCKPHIKNLSELTMNAIVKVVYDTHLLKVKKTPDEIKRLYIRKEGDDFITNHSSGRNWDNLYTICDDFFMFEKTHREEILIIYIYIIFLSLSTEYETERIYYETIVEKIKKSITDNYLAITDDEIRKKEIFLSLLNDEKNKNKKEILMLNYLNDEYLFISKNYKNYKNIKEVIKYIIEFKTTPDMDYSLFEENNDNEEAFGFAGGRKRRTRKKKHFSKKHFSKKCHKTLRRKCHKTLKRKSKKTLRRKKT